MPSRKNIYDLTHDALVIECRELGQKAYRAVQLLNWLYTNRVSSFSEMSNLQEKLQDQLDERFSIELPSITRRQESEDGSSKYLLQLGDDARIETVIIRNDNRTTLCVSSQVGCKLGCTFCRTAKMGFVRNLTPGEITGQLLSIEREIEGKIDNVVLMGMGEPLDNIVNVLKAVSNFTNVEALGMSPRRITISTAGLPHEMLLLRKAYPSLGLSVSLNASDSQLRSELMPIENKHSIADILESIRKMKPDSQNPVTIEYVLIKGKNDSQSQAESLVELLQDTRPVKVNLIRYNPTEESGFDPPGEKDVLAFQNLIRASGIECFIRKSAGPDISAACGQLAVDYTDSG